MCGIAGIIRYDVDATCSREALHAMQRALQHRGPDGCGEVYAGHAALGHRRLAVIDAAGGGQPLVSADKRYTLTYNGEIYNFRELRERLAGQWTFYSNCDTEVVLAAWCVWGRACVNYFNGMFAFFVWDAHSQTGFAARDCLGIKPFVYAHTDGVFHFASEAKAILAARPGRPKLNADAVLEYFIAPYFSGVSQTPFEGIEILPAGCYASISRHGLQVERWYQSELVQDEAQTAEPAAPPEELADLVRTAVQRTLFADARVGVYLSGGLDSTLIAAIAQEHSRTRLPAYTINFSGQAAYDYARSSIVLSDDTPYACAAAAQLGLQHELVDVSNDAVLNSVNAVAGINDLLPAWEQELAQHHLARAASRHCKVVLVGDAADELHYGYHFLLNPEVSSSPLSILQRFGLPPLRAEYRHFPAQLSRRYQALAERAGHHWKTPGASVLATTFLIQQRWLPRLLHNGDVHAMAFSLEARVPFGDRGLLTHASKTRPTCAYRDGNEKHLLRQAMRGVVPEGIRLRKKSALPKNQALDAGYKEALRESLSNPPQALREFLEIDVLRDWCRPERALSETERGHMFRAHAFSRWLDHYQVEL